MITTKFLTDEISYNGPELRSLFLYEKGLKGDGVLSWFGPCDIKTNDLVDAEDRVNKDYIKASKMVHFLAEFFHKDIFFGICVQRLMAEMIIDVLIALTDKSYTRSGDDIYIEGKKLNVSIATVSPLSTLIHFGVNIDSKGAPVSAIGLNDLGVDPVTFVNSCLEKFEKEFEDIYQASVKVISV